MKLYIDKGLIKLDKNLDNPVFKTPWIKQLMENGCTNPAEIFYKYDYKKFKDDPNFISLLDYSYNTDLSKLLDSFLK